MVRVIGKFRCNLLFEGDDTGMETQLKNVPYPESRFFLDFSESLHIPWIQHQRFLANGIGLDSKGEADVGVMKVVGGADADKINPLSLPSKLFRELLLAVIGSSGFVRCKAGSFL